MNHLKEMSKKNNVNLMTQTPVIPTVESHFHWENNHNSQV